MLTCFSRIHLVRRMLCLASGASAFAPPAYTHQHLLPIFDALYRAAHLHASYTFCLLFILDSHHPSILQNSSIPLSSTSPIATHCYLLDLAYFLDFLSLFLLLSGLARKMLLQTLEAGLRFPLQSFRLVWTHFLSRFICSQDSRLGSPILIKTVIPLYLSFMS